VGGNPAFKNRDFHFRGNDNSSFFPRYQALLGSVCTRSSASRIPAKQSLVTRQILPDDRELIAEYLANETKLYHDWLVAVSQPQSYVLTAYHCSGFPPARE